jgi:hypothetical protein
VDLDGPVFTAWDRRLLLVGLAQLGMAEAVIFPAGGDWLRRPRVLHRRSVVVAPDTFERVDCLRRPELGTAIEALRAEGTKPRTRDRSDSSRWRLTRSRETPRRSSRR